MILIKMLYQLKAVFNHSEYIGPTYYSLDAIKCVEPNNPDSQTHLHSAESYGKETTNSQENLI